MTNQKSRNVVFSAFGHELFSFSEPTYCNVHSILLQLQVIELKRLRYLLPWSDAEVL